MSDEWLTGHRVVAEVLAAERRKVHRLVIRDGPRSAPLQAIRERAERLGIDVEPATAEDFRRLGQGGAERVAARVAPFVYRDAAAVPVGRGPGGSMLVVLDHLEDPQNVGAIMRTAEAAGCAGVCLPRRRAVGVTPAVVRASAGAVEHLPVFRVGNIASLVKWLRGNGYWVVALDGDGDERWDQVDYRSHIALVVGGEGKGVARLVREHCDHQVALPLHGRVGSLNAAAAFAAVAYEVVRQQHS